MARTILRVHIVATVALAKQRISIVKILCINTYIHEFQVMLTAIQPQHQQVLARSINIYYKLVTKSRWH